MCIETAEKSILEKTRKYNEKGRNQGIKHSGVAGPDYRELKVAHAISPSDNPAKITKDRRDIARLKTVLRQKEIAAAKEAASK